MENIKIDITINGETNKLSDCLINKIKEFIKGDLTCKKDPLNIMTREDILNYHGIDKCEFDKCLPFLAKQEVAFKYLKLLIEALNDGWKPDLTDRNQNKWYNWFRMENGEFVFHGTDYIFGRMDVPSALYFKSEELAIYCKDNFMDLYREYYL